MRSYPAFFLQRNVPNRTEFEKGISKSSALKQSILDFMLLRCKVKVTQKPLW